MANPFMLITPYLLDMTREYLFQGILRYNQAPTQGDHVANKAYVDSVVGLATNHEYKQAFIETVQGTAQLVQGILIDNDTSLMTIIQVGVTPVAIVQDPADHAPAGSIKTVYISDDGTESTLNFNDALPQGETIFVNVPVAIS